MVKKQYILWSLVFIMFLMSSVPVQAEETRPIQLSLVTPIQIFSEDYGITGVRLNLLYGRNATVTGLDLGLVNHTTTGQSKGLQ